MKNLYLAPAYTTALAAALLAVPMVATPTHPASAQFGISLNVTVAPPELPVYEQPPLPEPGYMWTPGYWAYGPLGYFWVPGTWVEPPQVGLLWTPGYWGWNNGIYVFNQGYWGDHVGFYGGINYGFGYGGFGYEGGEWRGGVFAYNRTVNNFGGVHVTNVYERNVTVVNDRHFSFNGPNGINVRPRPEEIAYAHETHVPPSAVQMQHRELAANNRDLLASVNHGHPAIAATPRPTAFTGPGVVAAHEAIAHPAAPVPTHTGGFGTHPGSAMAPHPGFTPTHTATMAPHTGYTAPHHTSYAPHPAYATHPGYTAPTHMAPPAPRPMAPPHAMPAPAPRPAPAPHPAPHPAAAPEKPHH